jgi:hypothetical protein
MTGSSGDGGVRMRTGIRSIAWTVLLVTLLACSAPRPTPSSSANSAVPEGPAKNLVIAQLNLTKGFGPWGFASTSGGGASLAEIHTVGLTSEDQNGNIEPRAAARLPSFDDSTMAVLPDGRMEAT